MFELYEIVSINIDIPDKDLVRGSKGTIVHIYSRGVAYEVEFISKETELTTQVLTLLSEYLLPQTIGT